jgi:hypothetical protein
MGVEAEGSGGGGILLARGMVVRELGGVMIYLMPLRLMKLSD